MVLIKRAGMGGKSKWGRVTMYLVHMTSQYTTECKTIIAQLDFKA